jgi:hypothetical protein
MINVTPRVAFGQQHVLGLLGGIALRVLGARRETEGLLMPKIPAAKKVGACVTFAGLTVCPHKVYLTPKQKKSVYGLHQKNATALTKLKAAAKKSPAPKSSARKKAPEDCLNLFAGRGLPVAAALPVGTLLREVSYGCLQKACRPTGDIDGVLRIGAMWRYRPGYQGCVGRGQTGGCENTQDTRDSPDRV